MAYRGRVGPTDPCQGSYVGNDIQLEPTSLPQAATALLAAMDTNPTERALIQAAAGRVLAAKAKLNKTSSAPPRLLNLHRQ